jgi:putative hydrolase of the HAD superfamily
MKLILDAGGVLVYPAYGAWHIGPLMMATRAAETLATPEFAHAHEKCRHLLREDARIDTEEEEFPFRREYLARMNDAMRWGFSEEEIDRFARDVIENAGRRMGLYSDLKDYLPVWRARYGLGLLSDTSPSLRRVLEEGGIWQYFDAHVFSTDVGATKPDPRMYAAIARKLNAEPKDCLFVDDFERNLLGAIGCGMRAVQMVRDEAADLWSLERWDGPVVRDFAELDGYAESLA